MEVNCRSRNKLMQELFFDGSRHPVGKAHTITLQESLKPAFLLG